MGREIVYCYKCQRRIVGADFAKGQAYQVGNHVSCSACAADLLPQLGSQERERLLSQMFKATQTRGQKSAPHGPPERTPPPVPHVVPAAPPQRPTSLLWIGVAAVAALLVAGVLALSGGSKAEPDAPAPTPKPRPAAAAPAPRENPEGARRQEAAQAALRKARDLVKVRADDLDGQIKAWQEAVWATDKTTCFEEAKRELDVLVARRRDLVGKGLAELDAQARPKLAAEDFKAASAVYEAARSRFGVVQWTGAIDTKLREINDRAVEAAAALRAKASAAPATPGLVAQWPLGEGKGNTTTDTSGRLQAQLKGSAGWVQAGSGSALKLDGNGAYVEFPNTPELDRLQSGNYSISIWFKPEALPKDPNEKTLGGAWALVMKAPLREGLLYIVDGKFMLVHWLAGAKWSSAASWSEGYPPGTWHHIAAVVDRAGGQNRLYVNGVHKHSEDWPKNNPAQDCGSERWMIGKVTYYGKDTYFARGAFSDLRFYERALDASEAATLHAAGPPAGK